MTSARVPLPDLAHLTDEQKKVADEVTGPRGEVRGPVWVWLHSAELAGRAQKLGESPTLGHGSGGTHFRACDLRPQRGTTRVTIFGSITSG